MDDAQLVQLGRLTASGRLSEKPCLIYSICGIGIADASNVYRVYDGSSTAGELKMTLVAGSYSSDFRLYASPMYFSKGIYVEFTTNGEEVTVQFMQLGG